MHILPSDQQNHLPNCQDVVIFSFEKHPKAHQCNDALIVQVIRMKDIFFLDSAQFEELPTLGSHQGGFRTLHPADFLHDSLQKFFEASLSWRLDSNEGSNLKNQHRTLAFPKFDQIETSLSCLDQSTLEHIVKRMQEGMDSIDWLNLCMPFLRCGTF
jgi:hypothetical protein